MEDNQEKELRKIRRNDFVKRYKSIVKITILFAIIIPIIISVFYYVPEKFVFIHTPFKPSDILSYCGSCLTYIGAIIIGIIVYDQAEKNNKQQRKDNNTVKVHYLNGKDITIYEHPHTGFNMTIPIDYDSISHKKVRVLIFKNSMESKAVYFECLAHIINSDKQCSEIEIQSINFIEEEFIKDDKNIYTIIVYFRAVKNNIETSNSIGVMGELKRKDANYVMKPDHIFL